jgi:hypothetical protein
VFAVYCPSCDRRTLLGVDEVEWVQNLAPGIAHCPNGHDVVVLSGDAFTPHEDPRCFEPGSSVWARPAKRLARALSSLTQRFEARRDLNGIFYRF